MYSVPKLLMQMKTDDDFRLIKFINDTAITKLSTDSVTFGEWKLNCNKLSQFRTMKAFCKSFGKNTLVYAIMRKIRVVTAIVIILVGLGFFLFENQFLSEK